MENINVKLLPSDVWIEILRRIPAADLLPLKAVSKTFKRLISEEFFIRLHLNGFTKLYPKATRAILIVDQLPPEISHSSYEFNTGTTRKLCDPDKRTISVWYNEPRIFYDQCKSDVSYHRHQVINSYHGLLLVETCGRVFLCNPITRSHKTLPVLFRSYRRGFDFWNIGYDDVSKQYKVFVLRRTENRHCALLHVFGVHRDGESRVTAVELGARIDCGEIKEGFCVNGNVHFLITSSESKTLIGSKTLIWSTHVVSVNVTTEKVKIQSCPCPKSIGYFGEKFFVANETFYLVQRRNDLNHEVWALQGVESENPNPYPNPNPNPNLIWVLTHVIDTHCVISSTDSTMLFKSHILGMFRTKVLIMIIKGERDVYLLCQYDLSSKEFEEVTVTSSVANDIKHVAIYNGRNSTCIIEHIDSLIDP